MQTIMKHKELNMTVCHSHLLFTEAVPVFAQWET